MKRRLWVYQVPSSWIANTRRNFRPYSCPSFSILSLPCTSRAPRPASSQGSWRAQPRPVASPHNPIRLLCQKMRHSLRVKVSFFLVFYSPEFSFVIVLIIRVLFKQYLGRWVWFGWSLWSHQLSQIVYQRNVEKVWFKCMAREQNSTKKLMYNIIQCNWKYWWLLKNFVVLVPKLTLHEY